MDKLNDTKPEQLASEPLADCTETKAPRMSPEAIDELYIEAWLDNPMGTKLDALRRAGHPNPSRQRAWQIHNRLEAEIDKRLDKQIQEQAAIGHKTLVELTKAAKSEAVRAQCASKLMDYAGKQKPDRLVIENRDPDDIDAEIAAVQKRILEAQGEDIPEGELH